MKDDLRTFKLIPQKKQFLADNIELIILLVASAMLTGVESDKFSFYAANFALFQFVLLIFLFRFYFTVQWIVTDEYIEYTRGIFVQEIDYLELYRVVDYKEQQNFIQKILNIKTLIIYSGDHSHEVLKIYGLNKDNNIIDFIRESVEQQKMKRKVYEITNL